MATAADDSNSAVERGDVRRNQSLRGTLTQKLSSARRQKIAEYRRGNRRSSIFASPEDEVIDIGAMADFEEAGDDERDDGHVLAMDAEEALVDNVGEAEEENSMPDESNPASSNQAIGSHLLTRNIFYLEVASNQRIRIAILLIYFMFFLTTILELLNSEIANTARNTPIAILPANATNGPLCLPRPDGTTCDPYEAVTTNEAKLLANTGVVSKGINISDWEGTGAKPGTHSFLAHQVYTSPFIMTDKSILDYHANPQLHPHWDDLVATIWVGYRGGSGGVFRVVYLDFEFERVDRTDWPESMIDEPFPVRLEGYACLRGANCDDIGQWRLMALDDEISHYPVRNVRGNLYKARITLYAHFLGEEAVDSIGWRFSVLGDPGGAVSEALMANEAGVDVLARFVVSGDEARPLVVAIVDTVVLTIYVFFVAWWIYTLQKSCGSVSNWVRENKWLLISSVGFIISVNPISVVLQLSMVANDEFSFNEEWWCASLIFGGFGTSMNMFILACFSDAPRRYVSSRWSFYGLKAAFCIIFFITFGLAQGSRFARVSGWDEPGTSISLGGRGYVTSAENWHHREQRNYSILMTVLMFLMVFGFCYYAWANNRSRRVLNSLPYALSRPMQLSSRFFFFATSLWILITFILMLVSMFGALGDEDKYFDHMDSLSSYVVALDRMHFLDGEYTSIYHEMFGLVFFVIFQRMFLPPECLGGSIVKAKTHYVSEKEQDRDAAQGSKRNLMVLELARLLMVCSKEVYLPFESDCEIPEPAPANGSETKSIAVTSVEKAVKIVKGSLGRKEEEKKREGEKEDSSIEAGRCGLQTESEGSLSDDDVPRKAQISVPLGDSSLMPDNTNPIETSKSSDTPKMRFAGGDGSAPGYLGWESTLKMGCTVVAHVSEPEGIDMHNTRVLILRHTETNDLIVSFRGTMTKKQVQTDLMSSRILVDLDTFLTASATKRCCIGKNHLTGDIEYIAPDVIEAKIRSGEIQKVRLMDLLPKHGQGAVPDYLESATKVSDGIEGVGQIHFGFWSSYNRVRRQLHTIIRDELLSSPGRLLLTGHSLGGAQATLCAYDMCRYVLPTIKKQLEGNSQAEKLRIACYSYGSPRVGCHSFKAAYNKLMPNTQRIVNDGDVITAMPPARLGFRHVGRENIFDRVGSIRVNPSLIEKKFTRSKNEVVSHKMDSYREVVVKSFHPITSEEQLAEIIRKAYYSDNPRCAFCKKRSTPQ